MLPAERGDVAHQLGRDVKAAAIKLGDRQLELSGLGRHQFGLAVGVARLDCEALPFHIAYLGIPSRKAFMLASGVLALPRDIQPIRGDLR